jgi:hypothetical protein
MIMIARKDEKIQDLQPSYVWSGTITLAIPNLEQQQAVGEKSIYT